jgi:hypothetical protein
MVEGLQRKVLIGKPALFYPIVAAGASVAEMNCPTVVMESPGKNGYTGVDYSHPIKLPSGLTSFVAVFIHSSGVAQ